MDVIVDNYFDLLETIGEKIEILETEIMEDPTKKSLNEIYKLKKQMIKLRRAIWPMRELITQLIREGSEFVAHTSTHYLRDVYDHTIQIIEAIEMNREILSGLLDSYLTKKSNQMNEIMKVLTLISTFFLPLSFITGLYGMNFVNMPEIKWEFGYIGIWIVMLTLTLGLYLYFKERKCKDKDKYSSF